ncbi:MAG: exodeoxyribonuclease VII large subunit, partial [Candidatus Saccharibacteria bacterium]
MNKPELILSPTDFVAIANQALEHVFGNVFIEGELSNFRISKNRWVYFDIKDDISKVACFGSVYQLPGPLKDGMLVKIGGQPRLHPQFGFKINFVSITPSGEGSINKAYELLRAKLNAEGLFLESRKRSIQYPPIKIGLITSNESAAYADFIKIINNRWPLLEIELYDVQVQGEAAINQIIDALTRANKMSDLAEVLVIIRGGGSSDDLAVFNDERVVRAIAASRIPTFVAIGHEINESLAEMVADKRASTPSNAAELLVPDKNSELKHLIQQKSILKSLLLNLVNN